MQDSVSLQGSPPARVLPDDLLCLLPDPITGQPLGTDNLELQYGDQRLQFQVLYSSDWTRRSLEGLLRRAEVVDQLPLVVVPYLDSEQLALLQRREVCGLDLCGNLAITLRGRWLLWVSGHPNRFKVDTALRDPYHGKSGLVGRALLDQPAYATSQALHGAVLRQGGQLSLALVSRALKAMRDDVIVGDRPGTRVLLVQPDTLLDRLAQSWAAANKKQQVVWQGRVAQPIPSFLPTLFQNAQSAGERAMVTGLGSASRHASITMENVAYVYAERPAALLGTLSATPGSHFANLEILAPPDPGVTYGAVTDAQGVRWASALQTYLEMCSGDIRLRESAAPLRSRLLAHVTDLLASHQSPMTEVTGLCLDSIAIPRTSKGERL